MINLLFALIFATSTLYCSEPQNNLVVRAIKYEYGLVKNFFSSTNKVITRQALLASHKQDLRDLGKQAAFLTVIAGTTGMGIYNRHSLYTWWQLFASKWSESYANLYATIKAQYHLASGAPEANTSKDVKDTAKVSNNNGDTSQKNLVNKDETQAQSVKNTSSPAPKDQKPAEPSGSPDKKDKVTSQKEKPVAQPKVSAVVSSTDNGAGIGVFSSNTEKKSAIKTQNDAPHSLGQSTESNGTDVKSTPADSSIEKNTQSESEKKGLQTAFALSKKKAAEGRKAKEAQAAELAAAQIEFQGGAENRLPIVVQTQEVVRLRVEESKDGEPNKDAAKEERPSLRTLPPQKKEEKVVETNKTPTETETSLPVKAELVEEEDESSEKEEEGLQALLALSKKTGAAMQAQDNATHSQGPRAPRSRKHKKQKKRNSPTQKKEFVVLSEEEVNLLSNRAQKVYNQQLAQFRQTERALKAQELANKFKEEEKQHGWDERKKQAIEKYNARNNQKNSAAVSKPQAPQQVDVASKEEPKDQTKQNIVSDLVQDNDLPKELTPEQKEQKKKEEEERWEKEKEEPRSSNPLQDSLNKGRKNIYGAAPTMRLKNQAEDFDKVRQKSQEKKVFSEKEKELAEIMRKKEKEGNDPENNAKFDALSKGQKELGSLLLDKIRKQEADDLLSKKLQGIRGGVRDTVVIPKPKPRPGLPTFVQDGQNVQKSDTSDVKNQSTDSKPAPADEWAV